LGREISRLEKKMKKKEESKNEMNGGMACSSIIPNYTRVTHDIQPIRG
jgi:hypothetical protein